MIYTWTVPGKPPGAADPTFSLNGNNAAKNTVASYSNAGAYTFQVTVTDRAGLSASSSVKVQVMQAFSSVMVSPSSPTVRANGTLRFAAVAADQFGHPLVPQPPLVWTSKGGGTFGRSGLFTAGADPGNFAVRVYSTRFGNVTGSAKVTVVR